MTTREIDRFIVDQFKGLYTNVEYDMLKNSLLRVVNKYKSKRYRNLQLAELTDMYGRFYQYAPEPSKTTYKLCLEVIKTVRAYINGEE